MTVPEKSAFEAEAAKGRSGLLREFWVFLRTTRKWWLIPILMALLLLGIFVVAGGTGAAPLIYTIF